MIIVHFRLTLHQLISGFDCNSELSLLAIKDKFLLHHEKLSIIPMYSRFSPLFFHKVMIPLLKSMHCWPQSRLLVPHVSFVMMHLIRQRNVRYFFAPSQTLLLSAQSYASYRIP